MVRHSIYATQETPPFAWYSVFHTSKESRRGNSRGPRHETTAEQAALLWQKRLERHTPSIISTRKLRVSWSFMEDLERWRRIIWSRATKIWTRFTDTASALVRNEQWQSLDWKKDGKIQYARIVSQIWYCRWLGKFGVSGPIVEHKA
jgi:hypothetical protein